MIRLCYRCCRVRLMCCVVYYDEYYVVYYMVQWNGSMRNQLTFIIYNLSHKKRLKKKLETKKLLKYTP